MTDPRNDLETREPSPAPMLTPVEARILGALMEKRWTTPDNYPLTVNALVQACNQKSSRVPVMNLEQGAVGHAVNRLRDRDLVHASLSARAERFEHKMAGALGLDRQGQAVLCVLMLRGPQTLGELRSNTARLSEFADLEAVRATLDQLMEREPPLVARVAPGPGRREERFAHLLCGAAGLELAAPGARSQPAGDDRLARLEEEVQRLRLELDALWQLTGPTARRPGRQEAD
jgi:uncharacterized protein YceH (UPF0502 family)